jgi:hypothetical protein
VRAKTVRRSNFGLLGGVRCGFFEMLLVRLEAPLGFEPGMEVCKLRGEPGGVYPLEPADQWVPTRTNLVHNPSLLSVVLDHALGGAYGLACGSASRHDSRQASLHVEFFRAIRTVREAWLPTTSSLRARTRVVLNKTRRCSRCQTPRRQS